MGSVSKQREQLDRLSRVVPNRTARRVADVVNQQQGFPVDTPWEDAVAATIANARRHHPNCTVSEAEKIENSDLTAAGIYMVQVSLTGDLVKADLSDPAAERAAAIERARVALEALDEQAKTEAIEASRRPPPDPGGTVDA